MRWHGIELRPYKPEGSHFRDISRQLLVGPEAGLACELRYFEIEPGGHSTLERHEHVHAVIILLGRGRVLVGSGVHEVARFDLVSVPALTWHQFRAPEDEALGFLCVVDVERDRPVRPTRAELRELRSLPEIADFIRS
jgi:quercetin dioxygenase-like cupin family protein